MPCSGNTTLAVQLAGSRLRNAISVLVICAHRVGTVRIPSVPCRAPCSSPRRTAGMTGVPAVADRRRPWSSRPRQSAVPTAEGWPQECYITYIIGPVAHMLPARPSALDALSSDPAATRDMHDAALQPGSALDAGMPRCGARAHRAPQGARLRSRPTAPWWRRRAPGSRVQISRRFSGASAQ